MNLRAGCLLAAALAAPVRAASGPTSSCIRVDPEYARMAAATGGQVMRVRPDEMAKATNADGWARGPQPTSAMLGRNQSVEVGVPLKVPTDAQAGDDHAIVFTATREDATSVYNSAVVQVIVLRPDEPEALR